MLCMYGGSACCEYQHFLVDVWLIKQAALTQIIKAYRREYEDKLLISRPFYNILCLSDTRYMLERLTEIKRKDFILLIVPFGVDPSISAI